MNNKLEALREKLADIEHQRWSDWQKYMHSKLRYAEIKGEDSKNYAYYLMEASDYERWERQIATPYAELSETEKQSDRNEVDRYWPLILALMDEVVESIVPEESEVPLEGSQAFELGYNSAIATIKNNYKEILCIK